MAISAMAVQETYAVRCRRSVRDFLAYVSGLRRDNRRSIGEWVADFGGHLLVSRPQVRRSTTVRAWLVAASRPWPSAMASGQVRTFLRGLEVISPVLPEAAGVVLPRRVDTSELRRWMQARAGWLRGYPVALALGLAAGLRLREAARILAQRGWEGLELKGGLARWRDAAQTKQNLRGDRRVADRVAVVPPGCTQAIRNLSLPWQASEAQVARVVRMTARSHTRLCGIATSR